jgi:hypothetical protein
MMLLCFGCQWQLKPNDDDAAANVSIARYDRIESLYLTTGDYSALQQMNTYFPMQTRTLIEDMLHIGKVDDPETNSRFLRFFQDSTLQRMLIDVQQQYADMDDVNEELASAFERLQEKMPALEIPHIYAQIGSFDQSIVVADGSLGISLDKYLGANYPFYQQNYSADQRRMMVRSMIVPDCLSFYLLSLYPLPLELVNTQKGRDQHMSKIQWVVNEVTEREVFQSDFVSAVDHYMNNNKGLSFDEMLRSSKTIFK